jgi:plastocyanin
MAVYRITIKTAALGASSRLTFDPNPLNVLQGDQIFWGNDDSQPHRLGRKTNGGVDDSFFMSHPIASDGDTSSTFSPMVAGDLIYVCTLGAGHENETGTIKVSDLPKPTA